MTRIAFVDIVLGGVFHAAVLFLVAAGLQLVFGVQKIVNLACGSFYALGAYFGITFLGYANGLGISPWLILPVLVLSGILLGLIGPPIERVLRTVYSRDESFQLLLTFALVLMFQDVFKFIWGANPRSLDSTYLIYGTLSAGDFSIPVYNLLVILAAIAIALMLRRLPWKAARISKEEALAQEAAAAAVGDPGSAGSRRAGL
jgi:branched-chain amino acid transport system permease protein